jgi:hypothetical protein
MAPRGLPIVGIVVHVPVIVAVLVAGLYELIVADCPAPGPDTI